MRFVDIGVAGAIGLSSIVMLLAFSPEPSALVLRQSEEQIAVRETLFTFASDHGLPWFQSASVATICASVMALSNSTVSYSASVDSASCAATPGSGATSFVIQAGSRTVVLEGWYDAQG